jgi:hypothetical protein
MPERPAMGTTWDETIHLILVKYVDLILDKRNTRLLNHTIEGVEKEKEQGLRLVLLLISYKIRDLDKPRSLDKILSVEVTRPLGSL